MSDYNYGGTDPDLIRRSGRHLYPDTPFIRFELKKSRLPGFVGMLNSGNPDLSKQAKDIGRAKRRQAEIAEGIDPEYRYSSGEHRIYGRIEFE